MQRTSALLLLAVPSACSQAFPRRVFEGTLKHHYNFLLPCTSGTDTGELTNFPWSRLGAPPQAVAVQVKLANTRQLRLVEGELGRVKDGFHFRVASSYI